MKRVYLDYASTTPLSPAVLKEMVRVERSVCGNAGAIHTEGVLAKRELSRAREDIARALSVRAAQIIFTSGGTESNNLALLGAVEARHKEGVAYTKMHVLISSIEHSSVRACAEELKRRGVSVSEIPVNQSGVVKMEALPTLLREETVAVSLMHVNNEVGIVEPVRKVGALIRETYKGKRRPIFHVDVSQSPLYFDVSPHSFYADALTLDGHKIYGPKGVGVLFIDTPTLLSPVLFGGGQEKGLRPGTEDPSRAVGMAAALADAVSRRRKTFDKVRSLRTVLLSEVKRLVPEAVIIAEKKECSPHIVALGVAGLDAEFAVLALDARGFAVSSKSSCIASGEGSFVLSALGFPELSQSTVRVSFGAATTRADIVRFVRAFAEVVRQKP